MLEVLRAKVEAMAEEVLVEEAMEPELPMEEQEEAVMVELVV